MKRLLSFWYYCRANIIAVYLVYGRPHDTYEEFCYLMGKFLENKRPK